MDNPYRPFHLRNEHLSLVFDVSPQQIPQLVYWGPRLSNPTEQELVNIIVASHESLEGNAPDELSRAGIIPLESTGWKGRPGLSGYRQGGRSWSPRFTPKEPTAAATESAEEDNLTTTFHLHDERNQLDLRIDVEILEGNLWRLRGALTNTDSTDYHLEELGFALPIPFEANEILDTSGRWGKERVAQRRPIVLGCDMREGRHGRTGFDAPGFTFVGRQGFSFAHDEVWGLHTAFSGNHRSWVEKLPSGDQVIGGSELLLPGEVTLKPAETYQSPWIYAIRCCGLDAAAHDVQRWMRSRDNHPTTARPVTLNVWEAAYFDQDFDKLRQLAKIASDIGVERFVLDDGWFLNRRNDWAGLGDWYVDPAVWPDGLSPLVDYVRELGMQFGLWFEPEMINEDSQLAARHPDWILAAQGSSASEDLPLEWRHQQVLNIGIEQAREHIRDRVISLVHEYGIDYIKWDHNRDLVEAGNTQKGGQASVAVQTRAVYKLMKEIKTACPGLEIESCSSGGGRIDLEIMQHTDRVWVSDCIDPVERQEMMRWLTQLIPYELMGTHVASPDSHTTGRHSTMSMRGATALFGHFGIEWDLTSADEEELEDLANWISYYKANRDFLHSANVVRCEVPDPSLWLHGVVNDERTRALFQLFSRQRSPITPRGRIRFNGLDDTTIYRVRPIIVGRAPSGLVAPEWFGLPRTDKELTNHRVFTRNQTIPGISLSGAVLMNVGLQIPRLHPEEVLLIELTAETTSI
ncbi:MAG: alpha-galactosidase [Actinomycetaceae bacterium]|nr:alpha-galactosidase [Actinomycetaceae bacterium]